MSSHDITIAIIEAVRAAGSRGCTAGHVARVVDRDFGETRSRMDALCIDGLLSSREEFDGERYLCTLYTIRGAA